MRDMMDDDSSSDMSSSPTSCSSSSSMTPPTSTFANPISIPLKSLPSPPIATLPELPLSSLLNIEESSPPSYYAYPSWPTGSHLSPSASCGGGGDRSNSYVSDQDLQDLEELELWGDIRIPVGMRRDEPPRFDMAWEPTGRLSLAIPSRSTTRPSKSKRRRKSSLKGPKVLSQMTPIQEE